MKKISAALLALFVFVGLANAAYFQAQTYLASGPVNMGGGPNMLERSVFASNTPNLAYSQWYVPGNGSPAISTSDYMLMNGFYWSRPYDLDTMGADGAAIKAREGYRYAWLICSDHVGDFAGSQDLFVAYSNDPQVLPEPTTMRTLYVYKTAISVVDQNGTTQNNYAPYQIPHMVYNPDTKNPAIGAGQNFFIYMESAANGLQHELGLLTSSDLLTATLVGPAIPTTAFGGWSSYGKPKRLGVNNWEVYALGTPSQTGGAPNTYKYTSTDGWVWTSTFTPTALYVNPVLTISGQDWMVNKQAGSLNDYLVLDSVNSNRQYTGTTNAISTAFGASDFGTGIPGPNSAYPGPTYLQDIEVYEEDGVATIYLSRGFPVQDHDFTNKGPYLGNFPDAYQVTADVSGTTFNVTSWPAGMPPLAAPFRIGRADKSYITAQLTGTGGAACPDPTCTGGIGTYSLNINLGTITSQTFNIYTNGGLWQQFVDLYYVTTDATAAASAAPLGVKGSCAAGTATIQWNNSLPHQNYRIYSGSSAGSQTNLQGTISGTSFSFTPPANQQTWIKVVTMNVTEQKSRVVNVYCSAQDAETNKHVNRVLNDGGTFGNISTDVLFIANANSWLTSNNARRYLQWWTDVRFGYKLDGSGFIAKIYDLGTTLLPRGGDYTPTTSNTWPSTSSNTSYSATSFRGTTPSWVNNASSAHGYYGNGRTNNIQRWNEMTLLSAYQKPGTASLAMFGYGEFTGFYLRHESGSSGNITFGLSQNFGVAYTTSTAAFSSATAAHVAAGVFDGSSMTTYLDGVAGTPVSVPTFSNPTLLTATVLRGQMPADSSNIPVLASGAASATRKPNYALSNEALGTFAANAIFSKGLPQAQVQSWGALYN